MITRFFSTSKPIHFVIVILFTFAVFMIVRISNLEDSLSFVLILKQLGFYTVLLISIFVFDFLVSKNNLTKKNGYNSFYDREVESTVSPHHLEFLATAIVYCY